MKTFIFKGEGHTLGNALRNLILKKYSTCSLALSCIFNTINQVIVYCCSPDVIFCGYTIPHPSENKLHLRIETREMSAVDVLREGLEQLKSLSDHILQTFEVVT